MPLFTGPQSTTLDYCESFTTVASVATTIGTALDVGLQIAPACDGVTPIEILCQVILQNSTGWAAGNTARLSVCDVTGGATPATGNEVLRLMTQGDTGTNSLQTVTMRRRITPPAGQRIYKAVLWTSVGTMTAKFLTALVGQTQPGILWARTAP